MRTTRRISKALGALAALGVATVAGACSTVSPEELDTSLASLRADMMQEMQSGDEALSTRIAGTERRTTALESDLQQMERDFQVTIQQFEEELRFDVPVYFAFDDATVEQEDEAVLDRFGAVVQKYYPEALITVEGFTDPAGTEEYNMALGLRRATAVRDYLTTSTTLTEDHVRAVSYGENTQRLVTPETWGPGTPGWENRRVVLVVDHDGEAPMMPATVTERPQT